MTLILIAVVAGLIAGISPCVLPVLPVVFVAGATTNSPSSWRRAVSIVLGLIISFSVLILAGAEIVSLFHLPQSFLHYLGIGLLIAIGIGLVFPVVGQLLERPFSRFVLGRQPTLAGGGFVIGLALGLVFVPCAGPVLSTIIVLGAKEHVNLETVFVTLAFSIGASGPAPRRSPSPAAHSSSERVAAIESATTAKGRWARSHRDGDRPSGLNVFNSLQTDVPGYTERPPATRRRFRDRFANNSRLSTGNKALTAALTKCDPSDPALRKVRHGAQLHRRHGVAQHPGGKPLTH